MTAASARAAVVSAAPANRKWTSSGPWPGRDSGAWNSRLLANHLPMVLIALHRMGADDARLEAYCHIYHEKNGLVPVPGPIGAVTSDNWREFLGQREREGDYRAFFASEVARLGATQAATVYLPQLFPGFAASALHAFMRMAYATMTDSDEETGIALAYWAATYLSLGAPQSCAPTTDDPAEVLAYMYGPSTFRHVETERDLLWHFMRAIAQKPEFAPVVDMLAIGPETHDRIARVSLALYAVDARLLRAACGDGNALAAADAAAHAGCGDAAALFLAGDCGACAEDRLSHLAERGSARSMAPHALAGLARDFSRSGDARRRARSEPLLFRWRRIQAIWRPALSNMRRRNG